MAFYLFVSPFGFANDGTAFRFDTREACDAAYDRLAKSGYGADGEADFRVITPGQARKKMRGDAATESFVSAGTAQDFDELFPPRPN